jgi:hypothetical protein
MSGDARNVPAQFDFLDQEDVPRLAICSNFIWLLCIAFLNELFGRFQGSGAVIHNKLL